MKIKVVIEDTYSDIYRAELYKNWFSLPKSYGWGNTPEEAIESCKRVYLRAVKKEQEKKSQSAHFKMSVRWNPED